jgi:hypothetical protein
MKPMVYKSTPFLSYHDIRTKDIDIIEDAFGLKSEFNDVISFLGFVESPPGNNLTKNLISRIRKKA